MKINIISHGSFSIEKEDRLKDYIKKTVFSKDGEDVGIVKDLVIHNREIKGIIIKKNIFSEKLYIDNQYVENFTKDGIMLKINPVFNCIGKLVFDSEGKIIGKVKKIIRKNETNHFESITVKKNIFSKEKIISVYDIMLMKKNVILKIAVE